MAKIQIKSKKLTPFGVFFRVMEQFDSTLSSVIYSTLGLLYALDYTNDWSIYGFNFFCNFSQRTLADIKIKL